MGSANRVRLSSIAEVTKGVTPATPALQIERWLSESLAYNIENVQSEQIRADRTEGDLIQVGADSSGDISIELSWGTFDHYFAQAFCNAWVAGAQPADPSVLENGTLKLYRTVIKEFLDMAPAVAFVYKGCVVNQISLAIAKRSKITGTISLMGLEIAEAKPAGATYLPETTTSPLNASSNVTSILLDDIPMTSCIDTMSVQILNNFRPKDCVGKFFHSDFNYGAFSVSGNMDLYFETMEQFNMYKAGTPFKLAIHIEDDAGNQYLLELLRCKFETLTTNATGENTDVMASGSYRCSGVGGVTARLTKTPA